MTFEAVALLANQTNFPFGQRKQVQCEATQSGVLFFFSPWLFLLATRDEQ